jgi:hypothetical protein
LITALPESAEEVFRPITTLPSHRKLTNLEVENLNKKNDPNHEPLCIFASTAEELV